MLELATRGHGQYTPQLVTLNAKHLINVSDSTDNHLATFPKDLGRLYIEVKGIAIAIY